MIHQHTMQSELSLSQTMEKPNQLSPRQAEWSCDILVELLQVVAQCIKATGE